ncbi:hypothetical protein Tco_0153155 [Tanacetum coccineum]
MVIKENLKVARDRQKSYADNRRKPLEFEVGDRVMLKVSPWKGVVHFGKKGKLAPRYVGPFEILERIGPVAYRLRLPEELIGVHDTFHVSNLKKCLGNANLHVPLNEIKIDKTLRFVEEPVEIMDREVRSLKRSRIPLVKVRWNSKRGPEFTWEREDYMKSKYPQLFVDRAVEPTTCVDIVWKLLVHQCSLSLDKLAMSPHHHKKFCMGVAIAKGCRDTINQEQGPGVEERLTIKLVKGEEVLKIETTMTTKDGTIIKFPGKFPEYKPTKEEEEIFKLKAICENVINDISDGEFGTESMG